MAKKRTYDRLPAMTESDPFRTFIAVVPYAPYLAGELPPAMGTILPFIGAILDLPRMRRLIKTALASARRRRPACGAWIPSWSRKSARAAAS